MTVSGVRVYSTSNESVNPSISRFIRIKTCGQLSYGEDLIVEDTIEITSGLWKVAVSHFVRDCYIVELKRVETAMSSSSSLEMD